MTGTPIEVTPNAPGGFAPPSLVEHWVNDHADYLYRFAALRLHDQIAAEDLVQETFLAALRSEASFSNNSGIRTWLTGILKHKIADHFRDLFRTPGQANSLSIDGSDAEFFEADGHWTAASDTEAEFDRAEFRRRLPVAVRSLPERLAAVYTLREIEGLDTGEICGMLDISPENLHVLLHRARVRLRQLIYS